MEVGEYLKECRIAITVQITSDHYSCGQGNNDVNVKNNSGEEYRLD